jgi:hypothetical protein
MNVEDILCGLYDLDRTDLRRVAWEALLMSDGPDKVSNKRVRNGIEVAEDHGDVSITFYVSGAWNV